MRNKTKDQWQLRREWVKEVKASNKKDEAQNNKKNNEPLLLKYF